jgi:alginate O-acetyltransferase complex protein AlgJ
LVAIDGASPVVVLGDSHTMVYRDGGDMLATGGGLLDHLAASFGFPVDREASKASGGDGARRGLARRAAGDRSFWQGKELVVWVFSEREFTQGRWEPIPAQP